MASPIDRVVAELRRPFTPEALHYKIQSTNQKNAMIVCYVDARQVAERLNLVCPAQWMDNHRPIIAGDKVVGVECSIGISPSGSSGYYVERSDVGISEGGIGGLKAVYSDAFKRAGVKWGIGAFAYYTPRTYIPISKLDRGKYLSREGEGDARDKYRRWLVAEGIERFGEPLDMGDQIESQGDTEVVPDSDRSLAGIEDPETPEPPKLPRGDDEQSNRTKLVRNAYANYKRRNKENWDEAERKFGLWLASQNIPAKLNELDPAQAEQVVEYLKGGE